MRHIIQLLTLVDSATCIGSDQGLQVFNKLKQAIDAILAKSEHAGATIEIQLQSIEVLEMTFARNCLASIVKTYLGECFLLMSGAKDADVLDNLDHACLAKGVNAYYQQDRVYRILGPALSPAANFLLATALRQTTQPLTSSLMTSVLNGLNGAESLNQVATKDASIGSRPAVAPVIFRLEGVDLPAETKEAGSARPDAEPMLGAEPETKQSKKQVSVQSISLRLSKLATLGLLRAQEGYSETGGRENHYLLPEKN